MVKNMTDTIGFCQETIPADCGFILFGATGNLASKKIIPALFGLCEKKLTPKNFYFLFVGRTPVTRQGLENMLAGIMAGQCISASGDSLKEFFARAEYLQADYESDEFYRRLSLRLDELDAKYGIPRQRLFYLAIPPAAFESITVKLKSSGLLTDPGDCTCWSRLIIEKPYGSSLERACAMDAGLRSHAGESQIYRIDHFTGKETVQNVLSLRSANSVFDETWNCRFIDHVQITVFEEQGLAGRAAFFDGLGLARDMMSHILQLAAITAMDLPASFSDTDFKKEKQRFFESVRVPDSGSMAGETVRAQYEGYLEEPGVAAGSKTETFIAFKFFVDNERWRGVPFYVRAGKKTGAKRTGISLVYKKPAHGIFRDMEIGFPNIFTFNIQPAEDMSFSLISKHPGPKLCFVPKTMRLDYRAESEGLPPPTDYERLLIEAMAGDQTLFLSEFEMHFLWRFLSPMLAAWQEAPEAGRLLTYPAGQPGPDLAAGLIGKDGRAWV